MSSPMVPTGNVHPTTGQPYSDKSKMTAALLQIFLGGLGIGRFYTGHTKIAVLQIVSNIACGAGAIWGLVDGIMILMNQNPTDVEGRPLRP